MSDDARLDALLDAHPAPRVSADLVERIVATAPAARVRRWAGWLLPASLGAGLTAASLAGVVTGVQLSRTAADSEAAIAAIAGEDSTSAWPEDAA